MCVCDKSLWLIAIRLGKKSQATAFPRVHPARFPCFGPVPLDKPTLNHFLNICRLGVKDLHQDILGRLKLQNPGIDQVLRLAQFRLPLPRLSHEYASSVFGLLAFSYQLLHGLSPDLSPSWKQNTLSASSVPG
jgi:hypothetical protein